MTLPRLNWSMVARQSLSGSTVADVLTVLKTECESGGAMFADGWTCEVDDPGTIQGLALKPPAAAVSDLRIILAGKAASIGTPTMLSPDTAANAVILVGISKGITTEVFGSFDDANPMGGGTFSGYWKACVVSSIAYITIYYCDEALCVVVDNNANNTGKYLLAGALFDPMSDHPDDAESNGRVYSMSVVGSVATTGAGGRPWNTTVANGVSTNSWFVHGTADGNGHTGSFAPGGSGWVASVKTYYTGNGFNTPGGTRVAVPNFLSVGTDFMGRLREIHVFYDELHASTLNKAGPVPAVYIAATHAIVSTTSGMGSVAFAASDNS